MNTQQQFSYDTEQSIEVGIDSIILPADVFIPKRAKGIVIFAHGSGSSRLSSRNRYVASVLNDAGVATMLIDLLSMEEEKIDTVTTELRFDIPLLARRLAAIGNWTSQQPLIGALNIGYFGASTGGGAALVAAAQTPNLIKAVVSRGGRPDLAGEALSSVKAPTLLIVGGLDFQVIELNKQAQAHLMVTNKLKIVPGATHLFEEPGTLEQVAKLASDWFVRYLFNVSSG